MTSYLNLGLSVHANNYDTSRFTTKYSTGGITRLLELTFINKSLAHKAEISPDQTHPTVGDMPNCPNNEDPKFEILVDKFTK